jgi:cell division septation protein DedD
MDDKDKGIVEKTIEAVEEFVSEIKDAAKHVMDPPEPLQPGDELVMLPTVDYGILAAPMPPEYVVVHHPRKASGKRGAKTAAKKPAQKSAKTSVKKAAKNKAAKKAKAKSAAKKNAKKAVKKKKAKKSRS